MSGGLGNQLFQLAAGLYSTQYNQRSKIILDTRYLNSYEAERVFELDFIIKYFPNIKINNKSTNIASIASRFRIARILDLILSEIAFISSHLKLINLNKKSIKWILLDGYFQHPNLCFPSEILKELYSQLLNEFYYVKSKIKNNNKKLISIHIRRGDLITSTKASRIFELIDIEYYRRAVKLFNKDVIYLVFGDDPNFTQKFANEINGIAVKNLNYSLQEEFMLMSFCDHYIISNSTFSWWASYFGYNPSKRVIAPRKWYTDAKLNEENYLLLNHFEYA